MSYAEAPTSALPLHPYYCPVTCPQCAEDDELESLRDRLECDAPKWSALWDQHIACNDCQRCWLNPQREIAALRQALFYLSIVIEARWDHGTWPADLREANNTARRLTDGKGDL